MSPDAERPALFAPRARRTPTAARPTAAGPTAAGPTGAGGEASPDAATEAFLTASRALVGVAATSLAQLDDITLPQFRALVVLAQGRSTVGALAAHLDVHPSTATRLCDRLVRKGLIERTRPDGDRRTTALALAPAGRRVVDEVTERRRAALRAVVARMSPADRRAAVAALAAFAAADPAPAGAERLGWPPPADPGPDLSGPEAGPGVAGSGGG